MGVLRMPTDPAISIFLSEWAVNKRSDWLGDSGEGSGKTALLQALKKSIFDIRVGMVLCCIIATVLLSIGATVLKPLGIVPKGIDIMLKMSEIYTQTLGEWIFPVFIVTLFAAFWGSYLVTTTGLLLATVIQRPMVMVLLAVSVGLVNYPLIFGMNIFCVTKMIDKEFRPGKLNLTIVALGFATGVGGLVLLILVRILKVFN